jgi:acetyl-CoA synthetase
LKTLGTVGEPINPEAWKWYYEVVGGSRCDIVDAYWQTETGAHAITGLSGVHPLKSGSASFPFYGIELVVIGPTVEGSGDTSIRIMEGNDVISILAIKTHWPSMVRTVYDNHQRFMNTYLAAYRKYHFGADGRYRDSDGYYWITGRVDDVLNVSGHRLGSAEIESALVSHECCIEAAVIGVPHDVENLAIASLRTVASRMVSPHRQS